MKIKSGQFSRYNAPITNKYPYLVTTLYRVYIDITCNTLKKETLAVRADVSLKPKILPYITVSGIFKERNLSKITSYSSIIGIDLDHIDIAIKTRIFCDPFLKPALIFVSPSGFGLKVFIRIEGGIPEQHNDYFNAISTYLYLNYGVTSDPVCRDISRACFLCHDYNAHFSATGRVLAADLLEIFPPATPAVETHGSASLSNIGVPHGNSSRGDAYRQGTALSLPVAAPLAPGSSCFDPYKANICGPYLPPEFTNIKSNPAIHTLAEQSLLAHGWHQNGTNWTRPGKEIKDGKSAIFNPPNVDGICIFTVFSSNAYPFQIRGYNDFQIIALLDHGGDIKTCFKDLIAKYPT